MAHSSGRRGRSSPRASTGSALILALLGRDEIRKAPTAYNNAWQAKAGLWLGLAGSLFLIGSIVGTAIEQASTKKTLLPVAAASTSAAASSDPAAAARLREEERRAEQAHAAAVLDAARAVVAKRSTLEIQLAAVETALAKKQIAQARRTVDGLWSDFVSLDKVYLVPDTDADAATREVLTGAAKMLTAYEAAQRNVEANEHVVFDAAFDALWDPKNAGRNEDLVFANVGKRFGFTGKETQAIYRRNEAEADRRLKSRADAEAKVLETQCGSRPAISALDGGSRAAEEYVKRSAHDPSSVDVERCTEPKVNPSTCWTMTCDVRATNALGAKVLNQVRFSVRQGVVVSAAQQ